MKPKKVFNDEEIIQMIQHKSNQNQALSQLYSQHYGMLEHYILSNSGDADDAADTIQEVMLVFVRLIQEAKFRGESTIKSFLYSITKNLWVTEIRKRKSTQARNEKYYDEAENLSPDISKSISEQENLNYIMRLFSELGNTCKSILTLFYYEEMNMKEICERLDFSSEQVLRNKKYKCLKSLTESVKNSPEVAHNLKKALRHE